MPLGRNANADPVASPCNRISAVDVRVPGKEIGVRNIVLCFDAGNRESTTCEFEFVAVRYDAWHLWDGEIKGIVCRFDCAFWILNRAAKGVPRNGSADCCESLKTKAGHPNITRRVSRDPCVKSRPTYGFQ